MFKFNRILVATAVLTFALGSNLGWAGSETTTGTVQISGAVPEIFSLQVRGVPGDLDLTPGTTVTNRPLAVLHIKRNLDLQTFVVSSDTVSGFPENGGTQAPMATFSIGVTAGCTNIDSAATVAAAALNAGGNLEVAAPSTLATGVEEECNLLGNWTTAAAGATFPLAGKYNMTLSMVMTSL